MSVEIRIPAEDELRATTDAGEAAFGVEQKDEDFERHMKMLSRERILGAYEERRPVGIAASFPFRLTVPGGEVAAAGVTWVGVLPSHRRRGILRQLMQRQLEDVRERGDAVAILWASEASIYGRFGYGVTAPAMQLDADRSRFALRDDPPSVGTVRLVDRDEALETFPRVYDAIRPTVPGFVSRPRDWWDSYLLADPEHWRRGAGPKFFAVLELDGEPAAFASYRIKMEWDDGYPKSQLRVLQTSAVSSVATRELWRFLFGVDLIARVQGGIDPGSPLFLMVNDPRCLQLRVSDGLWLRFVDVEAAFGARAYATDESVVLEVRDEGCPWNAGRWLIGNETSRTDAAAELELDVRDLASVYLGAFDFHQLAAAERVRELAPGALARASELFRTTRPPYCPEDF